MNNVVITARHRTRYTIRTTLLPFDDVLDPERQLDSIVSLLVRRIKLPTGVEVIVEFLTTK